MVFLNVELDDLPVLPLCDSLEYAGELLLNLLWPKYLTSVLWRPDEMIFQVVKTM